MNEIEYERQNVYTAGNIIGGKYERPGKRKKKEIGWESKGPFP